MNSKRPLLPGSLVLAVAWLLCLNLSGSAFGATQSSVASQETIEKIQTEGRARVIVKLRLSSTYNSESEMSRRAMRRQRTEIAAVQQRVRDYLQGTSHTVRREFKTLPFLALQIDAEGLTRLEAAGLDVESIYEDRVAQLFLTESILQIEGDLTHQAGLHGSGSMIAIVDSGVDKNHSFLAGRVIEEACYATSESGVGGDCPDGQATQTTIGAGVPCAFAPGSCWHGTHVAGIAAGSGSSFSGVAPAASLMSIQVFHASNICGFFEENPCARAYSSDIVAALERVYEIRDQYSFAAVNLSLGGQTSSSTCDAAFPELATVINNLKAAGIATVIAAGNGGFDDAIAWPACISSAISVGAVDENDAVAYFSNVSDDLSLFAPGTSIESSIPDEGFAWSSGTSMAAPHVAGVWAVLEEVFPAATVDDNLTLLQTTGRPVTDIRGAVSVTKPRIRLGSAAGLEYPLPVLTSIAPSSVTAWSYGTTLTVTGSDFTRSTVVFVDGAAAPTSFVSDTVLTASLSESDLATTAPSLAISVFTPPPGGGASASIALNILQPVLTVDATTANVGDLVTVTLINGPGGNYDWLALAGVGDPDTTYITFAYVERGSTSSTWTALMPSTPGDYEFRLFATNTYTRLTTSPTVSVQDAVPEPPPDPPPPTGPATLGVDLTSVSGGGSVTMTLTDGPGNNYDWLALAGVGDPDTSYMQFMYVAAGATAATWTVTMPATPGDYEFRLFENNGYTRLATSPTVTVAAEVPEPPPDPPPTGPATLDVDMTSVSGGDSVTMTLTDGPGNSYDWLALTGVGDPDATSIQWIYVAPGATTATWTVTMPATPGDYEFRLFENNGYTRLATSPTVTVQAELPEPPPPAASPTLEVDMTSVSGGGSVTMTLTGGPGNSYDWLALAGVGDPDATSIQWIYVAPGATTTTWTVTMPATPGDYEFRLFENNGYTRLATSPTVTVGAADPEPPPDPPPTGAATLDVDMTSVSGGASVTMTLTDGPGNSYDWLALAGVGDPDATSIQWIYVAPGATTTTWTVTMPATPGDYEFRLFENNGYTRLATSPTVVVSP